MRKILLSALFLTLIVTSYSTNDNGSTLPYEEHTLANTTAATLLEYEILDKVSNLYGLDKRLSSSHVISFKKFGTYAKGELRILGFLTPEGVELAKEKGYTDINEELSFSCDFEYSYKTKKYIWISNYPYATKKEEKHI